MAVLNINPYAFTSADVGATDYLATKGTGGRHRIHGIRWIGATTAAHAAIIHDTSGRVIWHAVADASNFLHESTIQFWLRDGLVINTLGSGTLYVYLEEGV